MSFLKNYNSIIDFIHEYDPAKNVKLTKTSISGDPAPLRGRGPNLKCRKTISRTVPRTDETVGFIEYVKKRISTFDSESFFKQRKDG
jgi:hypothetical protein